MSRKKEAKATASKNPEVIAAQEERDKLLEEATAAVHSVDELIREYEEANGRDKK